jgi:pimeloyl-ACP methyl ester carboxylesterase
VLLHGFTHDSRVWRPQLENLSGRYAVVAWDAPGAGASHDPAGPFGIEDWADVLAGFLDAVAIDRAHVLGLSWGGLLAQELYRRHPERVGSLILADTYAGWMGSLPEGVAEQRLAAAMRDSHLPPDDFVPLYLPAMFGPSSPAETRDELARIMADFHPKGFRLMAASLAGADTRELLRRVRVPTLLVWGDHDVRSPLSVGQEMNSLIPSSRLAVIPGAGHVSNLENPTLFDAEVESLLRSA